jgi:hypothetical protein
LCSVHPPQRSDPEIKIENSGSHVDLKFNFSEVPALIAANANETLFREVVTTSVLGQTQVSKSGFEMADGRPLIIDGDYFGNIRKLKAICPGPFNELKATNVLRAW